MNEQHGAACVMVIGIHRVTLLCVIVLSTGFIFGTQAAATDSRVTELANKAGIRILRDSSSDKRLQKTAAAQVPLARMSAKSQRRANHLLKNTSQYRRMHSLQYEVDPSLYQYLINHPDVAIATWRVMGISKLNMWQTAPFEYAAEANDGSKGQADVLWRDGNQCLFVVEGAYHSPLLPTAIEASALVWMRYRFERTRDNRIVVNQQIETFINFPSPAIEAIAKLASMVTNSILDRNVMEVSLYAQMMSRAIKKDSNWVEEVAARMDKVPEHRKIELTRVARGMNPYESQTNGSIASTKMQQPSRGSVQPGTSTSKAGMSMVPQVATNRTAAKSDNELSASKQQLLQAVRAGKVVVVVKQNPTQDISQPPATAIKKTDSLRSVSLSHSDTKSTLLQKQLSPQPASPTTKAKTKDSVIASPSSTANSQKSISLRQQKLAASGPVQAKPAAAKPADTRTVYTGHSKDGISKANYLANLATGPIANPADSRSNSPIVGSNGDQPALITLPPTTASSAAVLDSTVQ